MFIDLSYNVLNDITVIITNEALLLKHNTQNIVIVTLCGHYKVYNYYAGTKKVI